MKKKRLLTALMATELLLSQLFSGATVFAGDPDADPAAPPAADLAGEYVEGEALICVKDQGSAFSADSVKAEIASAYGNDISDLSIETIFDRDPAFGYASNGTAAGTDDWSIQYVKSATMSTSELISALESKPGVIYAQPNYIYENVPENEEKILYTADGTTFADLSDFQFAYGAGPGGIDVPDWNMEDNLNAEGVVVAVLDSGVDHTNPDLAPVMWTEGLSDKYPSLKQFGGNQYGVNTGYVNADGLPANGVSADTGDNVNGHGTHCAGIIAAAWNGEGVSGAANGCKIMAVKNATNGKGNSNSATNVMGFSYIMCAAMDGVNVVAVNCSWGGLACDVVTTMAVEALGEVGVVTCFAAGNSSLDIDINSDTASLMSGTSSQICVDSATEEGKRSDFSNYGVRNTDVFSPGSHILSTYPVALSDMMPEIAVSAPAMDADGEDFMDDFTGETTYFNYEVNSESGTTVTIADGVMKISGTDLSGNDDLSAETMGRAGAGRAVALTISANKALPVLSDGKTYTLMIERKAEQDLMFMMVYMKTVSGAWDRPGYTYNMDESFTAESYPLSGTGLYTGENFDLENPEIRIVMYHSEDNGEILTNLSDAYINRIWITSTGKMPFAYANGTSMATPAVVGAVAVVAAAFPDDSAYKRASRILASVRKSDQFADICETGGMVNVRNALDESTYTPVLNNVGYTADGKIAFSGYFFGEKENTSLTVRQGEKSWSTADGSLNVVAVNKDAAGAATDAEAVIIECPEGIRRGELVVSISDSAKAEGRQSYTKYMEIGDPLPSVSSDTMYKRIPITTEQEAAIFGAQVETMTAINGKFYIAGADYVSGEYKTIVYDGEKTEVLGGEQGIPYSGGIAAWNGKIVSSDGEHLFIYDPEKRSLEYTELTAPYHFEEMDYAIDSLYNDGTELLLFRTEMVYYEPLENYVYAPTEVWLVKDPFNGIMEQLGTLRNCYRGIPIVGQLEKEDGSREYYIFGSQGFAEAAFGGECFSISPELSSTVLSNMFSDDVKIFADEMNPVAGVAVKDGIFLTGMVSLKDKDAKVQDITADNFFLRYDNIAAGFLPLEKRLSETRVFAPVVGAYDGEVLVYGLDTPAGSTESLAALYSIEMETAPAVGEQIVERKTDTSVKVKKIKMESKKTVSIDYVEKLNCEVTFADAAKTTPVIFESSNDSVLKVNGYTGELFGIRPGTATVTASCGNKKAKCVVTVTVSNQVAVVTTVRNHSDDDLLVMNEGEVDSWQLQYAYLSGKEKVTWKTSDKRVVTVNKGIFTAKKSGNAVITATWTNGSESKEFKFNVSVNAVEVPKALTGDRSVKLSVEKSSLKLNAGDVQNFSASMKGTVPDDYVVKFSSTNVNLLTIGEDGTESEEITPDSKKATVSLNAVGAGTVYMVVEGYSKSAPDKVNRKIVKLTLSAPAQSITLYDDPFGYNREGAIYLKKGAVTSLIYKLEPEVCTDAANVKFKVKGGTVSVKNGVITAKKVKKDKSGNYVPSTVTIIAGKQKVEVKVYVTD